MQIDSLNGAILGEEQIVEAHVYQFNSQAEADDFYSSVTDQLNQGYTGPIQLPDGTNLRPLTNGEKWLLEKCLGIILFFMLFNAIR